LKVETLLKHLKTTNNNVCVVDFKSAV